MKKYIKQLLAAVGFSSVAMSAHAGIPVIDGVAIVNLVLSYAQQGMDYAQQIEQYAKQLEQLTTEQGALSAITGGRGMGALLDNPTMRQVAPTAAYNNGFTMSGATAAATQALAQLNSAKNRTSMLQGLTSAIDSTADAKASTDLQARLQAETAHLLNENIMIQVAKDNQAAQAAVQANLNAEAGTTTLHGTTSPF